MSCPSCRAGVAAGASRCGSCGALLAIPTEGALAPDLSRIREIPGTRKQQRTWKDEVRERVQTRRAARTSPGGDLVDAPAETETETDGDIVVEQRAPEGTLVELGGDEPLAPYAVTEKLQKPLAFDEDVVDLPLTPPAPRVEEPAPAPVDETPAVAVEKPRVEKPRVEMQVPMAPPREEPAPRVLVEEPRFRATQPIRLDEVETESPEVAAVLDRIGVAPLGERALAAAIDCALWAALSGLVLYFASRVAHVPMSGLGAAWPWLGAFLAFLGIVYGAWFTGTTGQTVGKIATGLRVVDEEGRPPGAARALVRAATGLLGIVAVGGGLVPILLDPQRRALHDRLASTRVVRA